MDNTPPPGIFGETELSFPLSTKADAPPGVWATDANEGTDRFIESELRAI